MVFDQRCTTHSEQLSGGEGWLAPALLFLPNPMNFTFSKFFYLLIALGLIILSFSWGRPSLRWLVVAYDAALIILAIIDSRRSQFPKDVLVTREFSGRFAVGAETTVSINVRNAKFQAVS